MLILALAALAASAIAQPGALKTFRDWTVGCDNGRACHATSLLVEGEDWEQARMMRIRRGPAPEAAAELTILAGQGQQEAKPAALIADGKRLPVRFTTNQEGDAVITVGQQETLAAVRSAKTLDVQDAGGKHLGRVSLAGASAALLYMDDAQKRVGTVTALARPGPKPASAVPPAPAVPVIRSAAQAAKTVLRLDGARLAALRKQHGCEPEQKDWPGYGVEQEPLDPDHTLILLGCGAGAYNTNELPLIATRRGAKIDVARASFDIDLAMAEPGMILLINSAWNAGEQLLTSFAKGRGIGDCGVGQDFAWDGTRFRLIEQIEMGECRGSMDYITTWRARLVKR